METDAKDPTSPHVLFQAALQELDAAARGFVLGSILLANDNDGTSDDAAGLAEPAAGRCRHALSILNSLPRPERLRLVGALAREALAPVPAGIEDVYEDILEQALRDQAPFVIRLLAAQESPVLQRVAVTVLRQRGVPLADDDDTQALGDVAPEMAAEIQRAVLAGIVSVPQVTTAADASRDPRRWTTLPASQLLAELTKAGADLLGASLRGADDGTVTRAIAHVDPDWSQRVLDAVRAPATSDETARCQRARQLTAGLVQEGGALDVLAFLGARDLADHLGQEDPDARLAIAQRLPPALRRELLAEEFPAADERAQLPISPPAVQGLR